MSTNYLIIANSSIDPSYYNSKQSSTYESISSYSDYLTEYLDKGYFAKESFIFKTGFDETAPSREYAKHNEEYLYGNRLPKLCNIYKSKQEILFPPQRDNC